MNPNKVLLNASNLHVGGGVQVATSVIGELTLMDGLPDQLAIWASDEVDQNLRSLGYDLTVLPHYSVVNSYGLKALNNEFQKKLNSFSKIFTIFGPLYTFSKKFVNITGFAQPWIIYPNNKIYADMHFIHKIKTRAKFSLQQFFFQRADNLVVELEHVARRLVDKKISAPQNVSVVNNCLSSVFLQAERWKEVNYNFSKDKIKIGFVGRNYPHKNTKIFPQIRDILKSEYNIDSDFYVTFSPEEWGACDQKFKSDICNVGVLKVDQCPAFYRNMDAVIFPSLLECFSATPLEAMVMERPLFASDMPFNHDICNEHAIYFDPLNPCDAAGKIASYFQNSESDAKSAFMLVSARKRALEFSHANKRASIYLQSLISKI
ncbi:glycosyltransferase [Pantoea eucrina]|uniref:glycosyltransferase n=1 Tax=Pantoea eucrina TaxID=472693 RepID=UPI00301C5D61